MKNWRDSASIILAANYKNSAKKVETNYDFKLLCLKRHKDSSFMPGNYVFPGGVVEPADADFKWKNLYKKFGFNDKHFLSLFPNDNYNNLSSSSSLSKSRPIIFKPKSANELPREVSLRITAIRETFEECGILIAQSNHKNSSHAHHFTINEKEQVVKWQKKVHNNATEFYELCESLQCYPDLWSLHEWSSWLTPAFLDGKRFNTIFFTACLKNIPDAEFDPKEMEDLRWDTPRNLIDKSAEFKFAPPQQYEIYKISKIYQLDNLLKYAIEQNKKGALFNLPIRVKLSNGIIYLLPGDVTYPEDIHLTEVRDIVKSNLTIHEFHNQSVGQKNRIEFHKGKNTLIKVIDD
ncbi:acyl-coenzyme A diphosphatase NUDT19 [Microplitis demolitor]|uniref:acyl-coenzyme A diphosphatase NUDT19 n=1 Tax=Microplitis demolitor TaxID=69319 RepID=UPI0004CD97B5|nr:acyl-coenzyme A diphosphatase NUDT19 [Microplitis demolitor]